jgi:glycine cleavage system aminomethyltransferase T
MKRSALHHHHQRAGATLREYYGWQLPATFSTAEAETERVAGAAGLADISYRPKFESAVRPPRNWWRLADSRYLITGEPPLPQPEQTFDLSGVYSDLLLAGPRSRDILGKLTSLNTSTEKLPNLACAAASVAHVHTIVLREDMRDVPAYHLLVTRDYAESFWEAVMHAGEEFSLTAFGMDALSRFRT